MTFFAGMTLISERYLDNKERGIAMGLAIGGLGFGILVGSFGAGFNSLFGKAIPFLVIVGLSLSGVSKF